MVTNPVKAVSKKNQPGIISVNDLADVGTGRWNSSSKLWSFREKIRRTLFYCCKVDCQTTLIKKLMNFVNVS